MPSNAWQMIQAGHSCHIVNRLQQRSIATGQTGNKREVLKHRNECFAQAFVHSRRPDFGSRWPMDDSGWGLG
jgi:hypothetical protein